MCEAHLCRSFVQAALAAVRQACLLLPVPAAGETSIKLPWLFAVLCAPALGRPLHVAPLYLLKLLLCSTPAQL